MTTTVYVIPDDDDGPPTMAFLDRALANRWSVALGTYTPEAVEITEAEPTKRTWYTCQAVQSASVHIPTGDRSVLVMRQPIAFARWGDAAPDEHSFGSAEEALAHCYGCATCDAGRRF